MVAVAEARIQKQRADEMTMKEASKRGGLKVEPMTDIKMGRGKANDPFYLGKWTYAG